MRILVVGAGATGGLFGARLAHAGRDVTFLVRAARAAQLREHGLAVLSPLGDFRIAPQIAQSETITAPFDLILLGLKAYQLDAAIEDFAPAVGPQTLILPMLNGMGHVDVLARRFGEEAALGGVCLVSSTVDDHGRIVQLHEMQGLVYGERSGARTERMLAVDAALQGAGFTATLSGDVVHAMWDKWLFIAALAASTCLLRGTIGDIVAAGGTPVIEGIYEECAAVMRAAGYEPTTVLVGDARARLTTPGLQLAASMYRDMLAGSRVEADAILGDLLERARGFGLATPLLAAAYTQLNVYQRALP